MDLEIQSLATTELFDSSPECTFSTYDPEKIYLQGGDDGDDVAFPTDADADIHGAETGVIEAIYENDKPALLAHSKRLFERVSEPWDRSITSKLLQLCCTFDSADCAAALLDGELGAVPLVNEIDEAGKSPLHTAAEYHAARCAELLMRKRARTDLRTKDGRAQLALEMSLSSARTDVVWTPDDNSIEDLVVLLGEKDLTTIRLISEKTKEVAEVACAKAVEGRIVALAALLVVAAEKINDTTLEFRDADSGGSKEKTTVYECVVREALSLGRETTSSSTPETANDISCSEKRKLLLAEIELLQLFGVVAQCRCTDTKVRSLGPLFRAVLAGDETVVALLLKTSIDIDEADAEGNSVLHYSVKASRAPSPQDIKILILLLKYGARISQKNKLGLTALHLAAGNGHLQALQILLVEDPDGINSKSEMKETPLFFAVKNDHMDSAELLLSWGANSEVLNLRRQRPIDLAKSQDMRFMLNPTNIGLMKRNFAVQQKHATWSQEDGSFLDNCEMLLSMTNEETTSERTASSTTTDNCKYFSSPHGCIRGEKCFYAHCEEVRQKVKQGTHRNRSSAMELKKKIFVGGLPPSLNSASLRKYFEENFGPVQDAKVLETQIGNQTQSRGFGFVTFKDEKPVSAAVQAHYVTIMDKQVEIKSMLPRWLLENESQKLSAQQNNQGKSDKLQLQAQLYGENFVEEEKPQQRSWLNNTLSGEITTCSDDAQALACTTFEGQRLPTWLKIFNKWLPSFLQDVSKHSREGEYALSSLKGDFRAKFGLELDHVSLGYPKLSDFMKCFSDLCCIRVVPIGRGGSPNHMVLVPRSSGSQQQLRRMLTIKSIIEEGDKYSNDSKSTCEEVTSVSCGNAGLDHDCIVCIGKQNPSIWSSLLNAPQKEDMSPDAQPKFMQLLKQDPLFHIRPWIQNEYNTAKGNGKNEMAGCIEEGNGNNLRHQPRHLVLEAFARSRKNRSFYFLREFDFYRNYYASVKEGRCFACNEQEVLWANFPCQHLLWCIDCKMQATLAARSFAHKCVVCDVEVQKVDLLTRHDYQQLVGQYIFHEEFPPLDPNQIRSPFTKKPSPSVGN